MRRLAVLLALVRLASGQDPEAGARFFDERVEPILRSRCLACHNEELKDGGVSFLDRASLLKAGPRGPAVVPGKPAESALIQAVRQQGDVRMPPGGSLSPDDIATLAAWIERGAPWGTRLVASAPLQAAPAAPFELWTFDRLDRVGGYPVTVLGHPRVVETPVGRAVEFNGVDDALFVDAYPLAGARAFTWEVVFRPDPGGAPEQRFFHFQEQGTENRLLFEIRVIGERWCLDSYALSAAGSRTLLNRARLHPLGAWYHAAMVYDGREFRNYVDGVLQGAGELQWTPHGPGRCSIGVRMNRQYFFKGAIRLARMTRAALTPVEFLKAR